MEIKNIYDFQDIVISALRYALGRRTYITKSTVDFIKAILQKAGTENSPCNFFIISVWD